MPAYTIMEPSKLCYELIKLFESLKLEAYVCPAGVLTIGYGHTGPDVKVDTKITEEQADKLLVMDVLNKAAYYVDTFVKVDLNQSHYDALVSLVFNIGGGNFRASTLLRKLNNWDYEGAAAEFPKWRKGGGKVLPGLVKRRALEQALFLVQQ